ncbi:MAG TPA: DUF2852 domain-containing protein [Stellaceae bacterium]|jgi:hypothetical protein|nr:DUF2852 domain-containing protein [Stellaceae bacterium]
MTSAAHDESYDDPRWRDRARGYGGDGPGGFSGGGCGWRQARWSRRNGEGARSAESWSSGWHPGHHWGPHFFSRPLLIAAMVLGFIWWWPIGLVLLAVTIARRRMFCGHHRWAAWHGGEHGAGPGPAWKSWFSGSSTGGPSSGNRAFDEYRAETLRRLEEEQKEFTEFLERLRFAKDKAEFDQFMNDRRNRPSGPPPEPPPAPAG